MTAFRIFLGVCAVLLVTYQLAVQHRERVDGEMFRAALRHGDLRAAEQDARLRRMRATQMCEPPHHYLPYPPGPCMCGAFRTEVTR